MPFAPVYWSYGDVASAQKLAQMVENVRTHSHAYAAGTVGGLPSQGADLGFRSWATGRSTGLFVSQVANVRRSVTIPLPAGRFATPPIVIPTLETVLDDRIVAAPESGRTTTEFLLECWTGTSATPAGGIAVQWIAFEPSAGT